MKYLTDILLQLKGVNLRSLSFSMSSLRRMDFRALLFALSSQQLDKYRPALILLTMTVIIYSCVGIFYKIAGLAFLGNVTFADPAAKAAVGAVTATTKEHFDTNKIIMDRNLFGSTYKEVAGEGMAGKGNQSGDITQMLELIGTVAGDRRYGFAIIEERGKNKQVLYKVGDTVAGAKIVKIMRSAIVLATGGREVILKMLEGRRSAIIPPPAEGGGPGAAGAAAVPVRQVVLNKGELGTTLKDMGMMLSQAQIRPFFSAGKPDGFMVSNMKQDGIFRKMGLVEGDVLQGVNDRQIRTADDMVEFYNRLKSGTSMTLKIKRQGEQEDLQVSFQ